jgi:hypothetical protein
MASPLHPSDVFPTPFGSLLLDPVLRRAMHNVASRPAEYDPSLYRNKEEPKLLLILTF